MVRRSTSSGAFSGSHLKSWPIGEPYFSNRVVPGLLPAGPDAVWLESRIGEDPAYVLIKDGEVTDTLVIPDLPGLPKERGGPYRTDRYWSIGPSGELVVGVSRDYEFQIRDPAGPVTTVRRAFDPIPVRPEEEDAWNRRFRWMEQQPQYRSPTASLPTRSEPG